MYIYLYIYRHIYIYTRIYTQIYLYRHLYMYKWEGARSRCALKVARGWPCPALAQPKQWLRRRHSFSNSSCAQEVPLYWAPFFGTTKDSPARGWGCHGGFEFWELQVRV